MKVEGEIITPAFRPLPTEMTFKILDTLDDWSLFACRLVSQHWCQVASTILQDRPTVTVSPYCPSVPKTEDSLANLIKCFKKSRKFCHPLPFANFELQGFERSVLECPDLERFFALSHPWNPASGLLIKCLSFDFFYPSLATLSHLERLIFQTAPHLRVLCLKFQLKRKEEETTQKEKNVDDKTQRDSTVAERMLPHLKVLRLKIHTGLNTSEFITRILEAAPNLEKIESPCWSGFHKGFAYFIENLNDLQPLVDAKKLHLVSQCNFTLSQDLVTSGLVTREKLAGFQPKVLDLGDGFVNNVQQIKSGSREIMWAVKDAVEELETDCCFGLLDILDLPRFSKLRVWTVECDGHPIFKYGRRNWDPFPKLEKICLSFGIGGNFFMTSGAWNMPSIPVIPSVQSLEIRPNDMFMSNRESKACFESMGVMCPNVRNLELFYYGTEHVDFSWLAPLIWTNMRKLETLQLPNKYCWSKRDCVDMMEAGFTGFSLETVRRLKATRAKRRPKVGKVEHLRVNPSIVQLTELKNLVIKNKDMLEVEGRKEVSKLLLPLSYKYAFNLMPQLVVQIF